LRHGHTRAALDALNEATELDRSYARAWTLKAEVYELPGNPQEAQKARKRAKPWGVGKFARSLRSTTSQDKRFFSGMRYYQRKTPPRCFLLQPFAL
jgi:predicted Zn-dependent protease